MKGTVRIAAGDVSLVLEADRGGRLRQIGWRPEPVDRGPFPPEVFPPVYPTWGDEGGTVPALRVTHHDGVTSTHLVLDGVAVERVEDGQVHRVRLHDPAESLSVVLAYRVFEDEAILEQWAEIEHGQPGPVTLHETAAAAPAVPAGEPWLTHWGGDWAGEWTVAEERLQRGGKVLESYGAVRPHLALSPFFLLSPNGPSGEEAGSVLSGALAWGGAVRLGFHVGHPPHDHVRLWCGHAPTGAAHTLDPGVTFVTPSVFWAWSSLGRRSLTQRWHRFVRAHVVRGGRRLRATVLNNWEATGFDFDAERLVSMIEGGRRIGAELFLLDDGWFGDEHPRDADDAGLGDWIPDPRKLPAGLAPVASAAAEHGQRFGIWVEPEMVNAASRCYQAHPEWVLAQPGRERREERQQLVLDLCRPEVRAFALDAVDSILRDTPGISYVKWDANRDVSEPGSGALPDDRQQNLWVETVRARWSLMADVAARHPSVELMLCASGGGRTDLGTLRFFHELWLSDNTDAVTRVRMQWAASHFLPPQILGAHVTRWGGQDLAFAAAVAMSARFGFDLDPASLSPEEAAVCRRASEAYAGFRDLVQLGDLHRLVSPGDRAALMFTGGGRAVAFAYVLAPGAGGGSFSLAGLDPAVAYRVASVDLAAGDSVLGIRSGAELMDSGGLAWPAGPAPAAAIWTLEAAG